MTRFQPRSRLAAAGLAYAVLAAAALLLYWWPEAKLLAGDEGHYQHTALAILAGDDWFDRNLLWPPLQALFLAAVYAVAGPSILAVQLLQLLLLAGCGLLLARLLHALTGDASSAGWAGIVLAVNPVTIGFATYLWPEIVHLALTLVLAWALYAARRASLADPGRPGPALAWSALAGSAYGLCLLSKSLLAVFWPFMLLPLIVWTIRQPTSREGAGLVSECSRPAVAGAGNVLRVLAFALAALLVTAPVLHRGWQDTGRPVIADSSWFNLWVGLQDRWRGDLVLDQTGQRLAEYLASADDHAGRVAFAQAQARQIVAEQGLATTLANQLGRQYFRLFDARSFVVAQLPGEHCAGYVSRYRIEPGAQASAIDLALRAWHLALLVLVAFGIAAWRDWRRPWLWLAVAFVGYQLAVLGLLHVKTRFLLPMLPVLCLFAGHALARIVCLRRETTPGVGLAEIWPRPRLLVALVLSALLLMLATLGPFLDRACA